AEDSERLGPVGSTIVAEVLIGLIRGGKDSILRQKDWQPTLGTTPGRFDLSDLLKLAEVLNWTFSRNSLEGETKMDTPRIIDMVLAKRQRMIQKPEEAIRNSMLGFAAIHGGKRSPAWRAYMLQFVDQDPLGKPVDERQLARLMATDGTDGDLEMDRHRA